MAKKTKEVESNTLASVVPLQASFLERYLIGQIVFNAQFQVATGKEISQFLRLKDSLKLSEIEEFMLANADKKQLTFDSNQMNNREEYKLTKDLMLYLRDKVLSNLALTGLAANAADKFFRQIFEAVGHPSEQES